MSWLTGMAAATGFALMAAIALIPLRHDDQPAQTLPPGSFSLIRGAPVMVGAANPADSDLSFELVAMTDAPRVESRSDWEIAQEAKRPRRILYFTARSCPPCDAFIRQTLIPEMMKSGWIVGAHPFAHIQIVDVAAEPEIAKAHNVTATPTFVRVVKGEEQARHKGAMTAVELAEFYKPSSL